MKYSRSRRHNSSFTFLEACASFFETENTFQLKMIVSGLIIVLMMGVVSVFVRVPTTWFDTTSHYYRSIQLANGDLFQKKDGNDAWYGGQVSTSQVQFITELEGWRNRALELHDENKRTHRESAFTLGWINDLSSIPYTSDTEFQVATNAVPYTPVVYSPYIAVLWMNKVLKLNVVKEYILLRLAGFTMGFMLLVYAIKVIPYGKWTVMAIGLNPTSIATMSSISADVYTTGIVMLFIAYSIRIGNYFILRQNIPQIESFIYSLMMIFVSFAKIPSFFLLGLPLFMLYLDKKYDLLGVRGRRLFIVCGGAALLMTLVWLGFVKGVNTGAFFNRHVDTMEQIKYILADIPRFIGVYLSSIVTFPYFVFQLAHENGTVGLIRGFPFYLYTLSLLLSPLVQDKRTLLQRNRDSIGFAVIKVLLYVLVLAATFLILYLQFSEIGSNKIEGVQVRYFIPYWLLLVSFRPRIKIKKDNYYFQGILAFLTVFPLLMYVGTMMIQLR